MRRRTLILVAATVLTLALIAAPEAFAAAGGGTSGFGGGEGGGGGGGRGAALYVILQILIRVALIGHGIGALVLIALILMAVLFTRVSPKAQAFWASWGNAGPAARRRTSQRQRKVELAAAEAADEDPAFAPERVKTAAARLFEHVQAAWDAGDRVRLRRLVAPELLAEWERRLDDFARHGWHNRVQVLGDPLVEYVGLAQTSNRVVVRITAKMRDFVDDANGNRVARSDRLGDSARIREFWTLVREPPGRWILGSIEQGAEGMHALSDQIVATPWSDEQAMRDESLVEGAVAEALPEGVTPGEVAKLEFDGDAHAAALDLSVADGRFAPDVIEVSARRAVKAWAAAVDGGKAELEAIAHTDAIRELLHPGDPSRRTRLVVRGPEVQRLRVVGLDAAAKPPTMTVEMDVRGCRYLEDRDTVAVVAGSRHRVTEFTERWTFALDGDEAQPWRIARVDSPLAAR